MGEEGGGRARGVGGGGRDQQQRVEMGKLEILYFHSAQLIHWLGSHHFLVQLFLTLLPLELTDKNWIFQRLGSGTL